MSRQLGGIEYEYAIKHNMYMLDDRETYDHLWEAALVIADMPEPEDWFVYWRPKPDDWELLD